MFYMGWCCLFCEFEFVEKGIKRFFVRKEKTCRAEVSLKFLTFFYDNHIIPHQLLYKKIRPSNKPIKILTFLSYSLI